MRKSFMRTILASLLCLSFLAVSPAKAMAANDDWNGVWTMNGYTMLILNGGGTIYNIDPNGNGLRVTVDEITDTFISGIMQDSDIDYWAEYYLTLNGDTLTFQHLYGMNKQVIPTSGTYTRTGGVQEASDRYMAHTGDYSAVNTAPAAPAQPEISQEMLAAMGLDPNTELTLEMMEQMGIDPSSYYGPQAAPAEAMPEGGYQPTTEAAYEPAAEAAYEEPATQTVIPEQPMSLPAYEPIAPSAEVQPEMPAETPVSEVTMTDSNSGGSAIYDNQVFSLEPIILDEWDPVTYAPTAVTGLSVFFAGHDPSKANLADFSNIVFYWNGAAMPTSVTGIEYNLMYDDPNTGLTDNTNVQITISPKLFGAGEYTCSFYYKGVPYSTRVRTIIGAAQTPPSGVEHPGQAADVQNGQPQNGDYLGDVLYSDIVAYINDYPIPTSITNGRTMVVAEDLRNYGFNVTWDANTWSLNISPNPGAPISPLPVEANIMPVGTVKFPYVYTDITTYLTGQIVESFAIDGKTLIDFELLSQYGNIEWEQASRSLRLTVN